MKVPTAVFLLTLLLYCFALCPGPYWLDSSEFSVAAYTLGVAHPPGHPLALLIGKLCTLLPLGSVALRVGFASALAGALAAVQVADLGALICRRVAARTETTLFDQLAGAAASLLFALSYGAAFSAVRPEVYALSTLLCLSGVHAVARLQETQDRRHLYFAALWFSLALCNHHLLALSVLAGAAVLALWEMRKHRLFVASARVMAIFLVGLSLYAYLPLRAAHHPVINWGVPTTWSRFFWVVSAQAFQKSLHHAALDIGGVTAALLGELTPIGLLLAVAGLYLLLRAPHTRALGVLLMLCAIGDAATVALIGFDPENPDAYGYLEAAVALLAVLTCALPVALQPILQRRHQRLFYVATSVVVVATWTLSALSLPRWWRARERSTENALAEFLDRAPLHAIVVSSYFQSIFALSYLQSVAGLRPDLTLLHRHFLTYPGYGDEFKLVHSELTGLIGERDVRPDPLLQHTTVIEYDLDLPRPLLERSQVVAMKGDLNEPETRKFAAWQTLLALHRMCRLHQEDAFATVLVEAKKLLGDSPDLSDLIAHCQQPDVDGWRPGVASAP